VGLAEALDRRRGRTMRERRCHSRTVQARVSTVLIIGIGADRIVWPSMAPGLRGFAIAGAGGGGAFPGLGRQVGLLKSNNASPTTLSRCSRSSGRDGADCRPRCFGVTWISRVTASVPFGCGNLSDVPGLGCLISPGPAKSLGLLDCKDLSWLATEVEGRRR